MIIIGIINVVAIAKAVVVVNVTLMVIIETLFTLLADGKGNCHLP